MVRTDVEIIGLEAENNYRSYSKHQICGVTVQVGSLLRFKFTVVESKSPISLNCIE